MHSKVKGDQGDPLSVWRVTVTNMCAAALEGVNLEPPDVETPVGITGPFACFVLLLRALLKNPFCQRMFFDSWLVDQAKKDRFIAIGAGVVLAAHLDEDVLTGRPIVHLEEVCGEVSPDDTVSLREAALTAHNEAAKYAAYHEINYQYNIRTSTPATNAKIFTPIFYDEFSNKVVRTIRNTGEKTLSQFVEEMIENLSEMAFPPGVPPPDPGKKKKRKNYLWKQAWRAALWGVIAKVADPVVALELARLFPDQQNKLKMKDVTPRDIAALVDVAREQGVHYTAGKIVLHVTVLACQWYPTLGSPSPDEWQTVLAAIATAEGGMNVRPSTGEYPKLLGLQPAKRRKTSD